VLISVLRSVGDRVRVLREGFSLDDDEDMSVKEITKIWVYEARYRIEVRPNLAVLELSFL
jgi:hypothetical protein